MNALKIVYEKWEGPYLIQAGSMYNGYISDNTCFISVWDMDAIEEVEDRDIDFCDLFHEFCETIRKYRVAGL